MVPVLVVSSVLSFAPSASAAIDYRRPPSTFCKQSTSKADLGGGNRMTDIEVYQLLRKSAFRYQPSLIPYIAALSMHEGANCAYVRHYNANSTDWGVTQLNDRVSAKQTHMLNWYGVTSIPAPAYRDNNAVRDTYTLRVYNATYELMSPNFKKDITTIMKPWVSTWPGKSTFWQDIPKYKHAYNWYLAHGYIK